MRPRSAAFTPVPARPRHPRDTPVQASSRPQPSPRPRPQPAASCRCSCLCCMSHSGLHVRPPPWALGTRSRLCFNVLQRPRLPLLPDAGLPPAPLNSGLVLSPTKRGRSNMVPPWSCALRGPTASAPHRLRPACGASVWVHVGAPSPLHHLLLSALQSQQPSRLEGGRGQVSAQPRPSPNGTCSVGGSCGSWGRVCVGGPGQSQKHLPAVQLRDPVQGHLRRPQGGWRGVSQALPVPQVTPAAPPQGGQELGQGRAGGSRTTILGPGPPCWRAWSGVSGLPVGL